MTLPGQLVQQEGFIAGKDWNIKGRTRLPNLQRRQWANTRHTLHRTLNLLSWLTLLVEHSPFHSSSGNASQWAVWRAKTNHLELAFNMKFHCYVGFSAVVKGLEDSHSVGHRLLIPLSREVSLRTKEINILLIICQLFPWGSLCFCTAKLKGNQTESIPGSQCRNELWPC